MVGGVQSWRNQIPYPLSGQPTNWRIVIPKKFSCCKVSRPLSGFSAWGFRKGQGIPRGVDFEGQWDLIAGLPDDWGKQRPHSWRVHTKSCTLGPRGEEQWHHRWLNQTSLLVLKGLLQGYGVAVAHHRDRGTGSCSSGKGPLVWALLEDVTSPTLEAIDSRAKQLTGREHSPTHQ